MTIINFIVRQTEEDTLNNSRFKFSTIYVSVRSTLKIQTQPNVNIISSLGIPGNGINLNKGFILK